MKKYIIVIAAISLTVSQSQASIFKKLFSKKKKTTTATTKSESQIKELPNDTKFSAENVVKRDFAEIKMELSGEWTIKKVYDKAINTEERAYIHLDFNESKLYGCNGCNVINGRFVVEDNSIHFSNLITSMRVCANSSQEKNIMKAINEAVCYVVTNNNGVDYLHLKDSRDHELLTLKRQNLSFLNGAWTIKDIAEDEVEANNIRIVIDIDQLSIHGNSGCNIINGVIMIDTEKDWGIQFEQLASTKMICPAIKLETALLVALEETTSVRKISDTEMQLLDKRNNVVITLKKLSLK